MATMTALYCRVSTSGQSLARQRQPTSEHATDALRIEPADIEGDTDKQTRIDTDRDGFRELMEAIEAGDVERIIDENEVGLDILDRGINVDSDERNAHMRVLDCGRTFAELEDEIALLDTDTSNSP